MAALLLCVFGFVTPQTCLVDRVDKIEINHVCNEYNGSIRGSYVLFWEWNGIDYVIVDWRHLKDAGHWEGAECDYRVSWRENGVVRIVKSQFVVETWTITDREIDNREIWPTYNRRLLRPFICKPMVP